MRVGVGVQRMERRAWGGGGSAAYGEKGMGWGWECSVWERKQDQPITARVTRGRSVV